MLLLFFFFPHSWATASDFKNLKTPSDRSSHLINPGFFSGLRRISRINSQRWVPRGSESGKEQEGVSQELSGLCLQFLCHLHRVNTQAIVSGAQDPHLRYIYRWKTLAAFTPEVSIGLRQSEPCGRQVGAPATRGSRVQTTHCFLLPLALFLPWREHV